MAYAELGGSCVEEELFIEKTSIVNGVSRKLAPLFTKLPKRVLLANPAYLTREGGRSASAKARREEVRTISTMMRSATTSSTALRTRIPTVGPRNTPGAPARRLSTQTTMVAPKLHAFIIHNPTATTRPTTPSTKPV